MKIRKKGKESRITTLDEDPRHLLLLTFVGLDDGDGVGFFDG